MTSYWDGFFFFHSLLEWLNLLVSEAFLMPVSSSGESWLRPMRSNLQHAKTEEQYSNATMGAICCLWTKEASVDLLLLLSRQLTMQASSRSCWVWQELMVCGGRWTHDIQH